MPFLMGLWKPIAIALTLAIIFALGYHKGYQSQKLKFDTFKSQIEANAKVQEQKNAELLIKQKKINDDTNKEYQNAIKKLNAHYAANTKRLLNNSTSSRLQQNAIATPIPDGEAKSDLPDTTRDITLDCASDVLQLLYLQKWIDDQQLIQ